MSLLRLPLLLWLCDVASFWARGLPLFGETGDSPYCCWNVRRVRHAFAKWFHLPHLLQMRPQARHEWLPGHVLLRHLPHVWRAGDLFGVLGRLFLLVLTLLVPVFWRFHACWNPGPLLRCRRCWDRPLRWLPRVSDGAAVWRAVMLRSNFCNCWEMTFSASNCWLASATSPSFATTANFNSAWTESGPAMARWGRSSARAPLMETSTTSTSGISICRAICCIRPTYCLKDSPGSCLAA